MSDVLIEEKIIAEKTFIEQVIREAAAKAGLENVVLYSADIKSIALPKPRLEFQFLPDSYIPTGRKIAKRREAIRDGEGVIRKQQVIVKELYEVDTPVMLYIIDNDDYRIGSLSRKLLLAFPKGVADTYNNWVRIRAVLGEWTGFQTTTLGKTMKRIEPIITRSYNIKVNFTWRLNEELVTPYIEHIELGVKNNE
jgi:hypothetical protein